MLTILFFSLALRATDLSIIPLEELYPPLPQNEKVSRFLAGKSFAACFPLRPQDESGYAPKSVQIVFTFEKEESIVHLFENFFGNSTCQGRCEDSENRCSIFDRAASFGVYREQPNDLYTMGFRPQQQISYDLWKISFAESSIQMGDPGSVDETGLPTRVTEKRTFREISLQDKK